MCARLEFHLPLDSFWQDYPSNSIAAAPFTNHPFFSSPIHSLTTIPHAFYDLRHPSNNPTQHFRGPLSIPHIKKYFNSAHDDGMTEFRKDSLFADDALQVSREACSADMYDIEYSISSSCILRVATGETIITSSEFASPLGKTNRHWCHGSWWYPSRICMHLFHPLMMQMPVTQQTQPKHDHIDQSLRQGPEHFTDRPRLGFRLGAICIHKRWNGFVRRRQTSPSNSRSKCGGNAKTR